MKFSDYINESDRSLEHKTDVVTKYDNENIDLQKTINKYSGYSNSDLMNEFLKLTLEKKNKGELNSVEISNIEKAILPYLNSEQKIELERILSMVKNV